MYCNGSNPLAFLDNERYGIIHGIVRIYTASPILKGIMKENKLDHEEKYVEFLKTRINSENFKKNVSPEEFKTTKAKYDKAKLKLKMMKAGAI